MKKVIGIFIMATAMVVTSLSYAGDISKKINPEEDSIVIGRIEDHVIAKSGELFHASDGGSREMKVEGIKLINLNSDKSTKVKLRKEECFCAQVSEGLFSLKFRANQKMKSLGQIDVPSGSLVNIGTYKVETKKTQASAKGGRGTMYTVNYRLKYRNDDDSYAVPLKQFQARYPDLYEKYKDRIVKRVPY